MRSTSAAGLALILATAALPAAGAPPLSANDWLSGGKAPPPVSAWRPGDPVPPDAARRAPKKRAEAAGEPVAADVRVPTVGVTRLDGPDADRAGTQSARGAGLPRDLWAGASTDAVIAALDSARPRLPATQRLLLTTLTAQLDPPRREAAADEGRLFLARIDRLIALGAVETAAQLMEAAGTGDAARFRRRFDAALLMGDEDRACAMMADRPGLAPDLPARLFCLARSGDWQAAALALRGAEGTGLLPEAEAARLAAFLDDTGTDAGTEAPPPDPVTPLDFRLMAAIGQPMATTGLPLAYAWSDLGTDGGWKARLEAAERLARAGSLPPARLREIYLEEKPAASGGVWDRAAAVQALHRAVAARDAAAVGAALPAAVTASGKAGLTGAFAAMLAPDLLALHLDGTAARQALHLALYQADVLGPRVIAALPTPADPPGFFAEAPLNRAGTAPPRETVPGCARRDSNP